MQSDRPTCGNDPLLICAGVFEGARLLSACLKLRAKLADHALPGAAGPRPGPGIA